LEGNKGKVKRIEAKFRDSVSSCRDLNKKEIKKLAEKPVKLKYERILTVILSFY
jgi:hypothetical protein